MKKILTYLYDKRRELITYRNEINNIKSKKNLIDKVTLTEEQEKKIDELWIKNYGKKISKDWHKLYISYMGIFNEKYFPEIFFTTKLLDKMNPKERKRYLSDKILASYFFKDIDNENCRIVKNIIYNCSGIFYDSNRNFEI